MIPAAVVRRTPGLSALGRGFLAAGLILFPISLGGQHAVSVSGHVTDSRGAPIAQAWVGVGNGRETSTDEIGHFHVAGVPLGNAVLRVRRLGFTPALAELNVPEGGLDGVGVRLIPLPTVLPPVEVRRARVEYSGRLGEYYERLARRGGSSFISRQQIDRENPRRLSHLLQRSPGLTVVRVRGGGAGVRMRNRNCWPLVWLDGVQMPSSEVDLDAIPPSTLEGVEVYLGSTTAPARYTDLRLMADCGTILLWSRGPDTDPVGRVFGNARHLEELVAAVSVFTADQVDRPAQLDTAHTVSVKYPQSLFASKTGGVVVVEFVVDAAGRVELETFGVISSPHPLFTSAVREAVAGATYLAAEKGGMKVRQLVQQPFEFSPGVRRPGSDSALAP